MILANARVYRGGESQDTIYERPYDVRLDCGPNKTLELRFRTNPGGERRSAFLVELVPQNYPVLLEYMAANLSNPLHAALLKAIAQDMAGEKEKAQPT